MTMAFVKHGDSRINLNRINEYRPNGEKGINFLTEREDGTSVVYRGWEFDSKEKRDKAIKNIDTKVSALNKAGTLFD